jgi:hypothetical protein
MEQIKFSHNWNGKLFLENFGTVRLHNPDKYRLDAKLELLLRNQFLGVVEVVAVKRFYYKNISDVLSHLDVGKPAHYLAGIIGRMYKDKVHPELLLDHVILQYKSRNLEAQSQMLHEWWKEVMAAQPYSQQLQAF